ncbi:CotO family spore coat protein [Oceanobacillus sp. FSL W8-0428]|uniref:Spore coat protein CotO n=1 Tax=Oceanobacillus sojae TaxID=582851 RepID=A0A511ZKR6_9BACI|nr:CotO family spore coat protein [Oceanobacillus sojae]GEN88052.1 hypothetical protein OSO01_27910 [Oceanobacillus sojae]
MTNKNKAQAPLLYISQPQLKEFSAPMQENYVGDYRRKRQTEMKSVPQAKRKQSKDGKNSDGDSSKTTEQQSSKKKFMEMTIIEKISYLTNRSEFAPPIKCEIITVSKKKYRGVIRENNSDTLALQLNNRKNKIEIAIKDIENIHLLGF